MTGYRVERQADGVVAILPMLHGISLQEAFRWAQHLAGWE